MNGSNFFSQLKQLCRTLENSLQEVSNDVENNQSGRSQAATFVKVNQLRKDVKEMMAKSNVVLEQVNRDNQHIYEITKIAHKIVTLHQGQVSEVKSMFTKYGYNAADAESQEKKIEEQNVNTDDDKSNNKVLNENGDTPVKDEQSTDLPKTPKPEDFGLSSLSVRKSKYPDILSHRKNKLESVPDIFHHDGLTVTPSMLEGHSLQSPAFKDVVGKDIPKFSLECQLSTDKRTGKENLPNNGPLKAIYHADVVTNSRDKCRDTPEAPQLKTPGFKQVPDIHKTSNTCSGESPFQPKTKLTYNYDEGSKVMAEGSRFAEKNILGTVNNFQQPVQPNLMRPFSKIPTPNTPEFITTKWKQMSCSMFQDNCDITGIHRLPNTPEIQPQVRMTKKLDIHGSSPDTPVLLSKITESQAVFSPDSRLLSGVQQSSQKYDPWVMQEPQMPKLRGKYSFL